jgi:hypothetical protein
MEQAALSLDRSNKHKKTKWHKRRQRPIYT